MTIKELKNSILEDTLKSDFFIFVGDPNNFLIHQYINYIIKDNEIREYSKEDILSYKEGFFPCSNYRLYKCENFDLINITTRNLIVVTSGVSDELKKIFPDNIVEFPQLEKWQIQDYSYVLGEGIDKEDLDTLNAICGENVYRIDSELSKLSGFTLSQKRYFFKDMLKEGALDDLVNYDVFSLTNALQARDLNKIAEILNKRKYLDIDPFAFISVLYQGFKKLATVWLTPNPSPENTGLKGNQIWAIKNIPHNYDKFQLVKILDFLASMDSSVKNGDLGEIDLLNYTICKVLSTT